MVITLSNNLFGYAPRNNYVLDDERGEVGYSNYI